MKLLILGCGTSTGVPIIGCDCSVCTSTDPRNNRTRSSALLKTPAGFILIDTSTDLRAQSLRNGLKRIDAVLLTHPHADHIHGIDDLRAFNMLQEGAIPCYGSAYTIERLKAMFDYIFSEDPSQSWRPNLTATVVDSRFEVSGVEIIPIEIYHGEATIFGFRIGNAAYLTDCSSIPEESLKKLRGLELLVLGALRHKPHPTHMSIDEAVEASRRIGAARTVLTHLSHAIDYTVDNGKLPEGVELAYDSMSIEVD
jgi:phosphoribosyl 1,2-cyclic phosphate phosphodiesterase